MNETPIGRGYTAGTAQQTHEEVRLRVRKAVFPAAGWGTRFLPATKAQPKEMLPLVDKPIIQYAVEEAVAAGIEQVIIVTSSQKRAIEDHFDLSLRARAPARGEGRDREAPPGPPHQRPRPGRVRPPEGAARARPRGAHGQGPHRPRAVRGDPARRRRRRRPAVHRPAHPRLRADPHLGRRRDGGPAPRTRAATASSPPSRPRTRSTTAGCTASPALVEKPSRGRRHRTSRSSAATS